MGALRLRLTMGALLDTLVGKTLSHYRILEQIGAGGMGVVYRAEDTRLRRTVALKFLPDELARDPKALERFQREARAISALNHPQICTIHDIGAHEDRSFLVMEYLEGKTLKERMGGKPILLKNLFEWGIQIADALEAAHRKGIVHRDIKPGNLFLTDTGQLKILDFGVSKRTPVGVAETETASSDEAVTGTGSVVGTLEYMSPEQARGEEVDSRTDIWSFGAVLYEMGTGRVPFAGSAPGAIYDAILNRAPAPIRRVNAGMPDDLDRLVSRALEKDRELRYQTASEIRTELKRLRRDLESGTPEPSLVAVAERHVVPPGVRDADSASLLSPVPTAPLLPTRRAGFTILLLSVAAAIALVVWPPVPIRALSVFKVTPAQAEDRARAVLNERGKSLYGFGSYTRGHSDPDLQKFASFLHLSSRERESLDRWRPNLYYQTTIVSADHQERYRFRLSPQGRVVQFSHGLRPDYQVVPVERDSAAVIARMAAAHILLLDVDKLEALPVGESIDAGRLVRDFRWKFDQPLPGGTVGNALVQVAGTEPVRAEIGLSLPAEAWTRISERRNYLDGPVSVLLVASLLQCVIVSVRKRWFIAPSSGVFVVAALVVIVSGFLSSEAPDFLGDISDQGFSATIPDLLSGVVEASFLALLVWASYGWSLGVLRRTAPEWMPGLSKALQARIERPTWARSAAVGVSVGILGLAGSTFGPWALQALGVAEWSPAYPIEPLFHPLRFPARMMLLAITAPASVGVGLAMVATMRHLGWLRRFLWPVVVLLAVSALTDPTKLSFQPVYVAVLVTGLVTALFIWATVRFGLLTGAICWCTSEALHFSIPLTAATLTPLKVAGFTVFVATLACVVAANFSVMRERAANTSR